MLVFRARMSRKNPVKREGCLSRKCVFQVFIWTTEPGFLRFVFAGRKASEGSELAAQNGRSSPSALICRGQQHTLRQRSAGE